MPTELEVQRRLTTAFILTMPVTIALQPRNKVKQPSGGFIWQNAVPREPQVMRLIEPGGSQSQAIPRPTVATDGVVREVMFMILGEWDAVLGMHDIFTYDGHDWEIVQIAHSNGWEQRASVARYG